MCPQGNLSLRSPGDFRIRERSARIIRRLYQAADHPVLAPFAGNFYLKGLLLEALAGR